MVFVMQSLHRAWTEVQVPEQFNDTAGTLNRFDRRSEGGRDNRWQGGPPRRQGLRSATRSQGQGTQFLAGHYEEEQQRAILPWQPHEDDGSSSVTDDTVFEDDTDWIEYIHSWRKQGEGVAERWESDIPHDSCDGQLAAYIDEDPRTPPSSGVWDSWKST